MTMYPERYIAYYRNQAGNGLPGYAGGPVMYGAPIHSDIFFQEKIMLNGVNIKK